MTLVILTGLLAFALVPGGHASPTGVRARDAADSCIASCRSNFGWPGHHFPSDPWGLVVNPKIDSPTVETPQAAGPPGAGGVEANPSDSSASTVDSTSLITLPSPTSLSVFSSASAPTSASGVLASFGVAHTSSSLSSIHRSSSSVPAPPPPPPTSSPAPPPPPETHSASPAPSPSSSPAPAPAAAAADPSSDSDQGSGSTSGSTSESDIQAYLAGHNNVRAQHGAAPLTYSQDLAAKAQQWANGCVFKHSGGTLGPLGENLAAGTGSGFGISQALKTWTDEVSQYDASNPVPSHFTQVVWKATTQVGCALQLCDGIFAASFGKASYYVCEYSPQGNIIGDFGTQVQA